MSQYTYRGTSSYIFPRVGSLKALNRIRVVPIKGPIAAAKSNLGSEYLPIQRRAICGLVIVARGETWHCDLGKFLTQEVVRIRGSFCDSIQPPRNFPLREGSSGSAKPTAKGLSLLQHGFAQSDSLWRHRLAQPHWNPGRSAHSMKAGGPKVSRHCCRDPCNAKLLCVLRHGHSCSTEAID